MTAESMMPSMSRTIAAWVEGLTFDDLPEEVVDRAKGVTLQALSSALIGHTRRTKPAA